MSEDRGIKKQAAQYGYQVGKISMKEKRVAFYKK
jgi:hypothetical protein